MTCRKNIKNLTPSERTAFVNAFIALMDDGTIDDFAAIHGGAGSHGHGGPAFVAWHREYVRRLELELQRIDSGVSLPYWDWTDSNLNTAGTESYIWRDDFLGGPGDNSGGGPPTGPFNGYPITSGAFAGRFTRRSFNIFSSPGTGGSIAADMLSSDFNVFRGIEGPHGSAHVFIGGDIMPFDKTAGTPDFWMIHCNVDRLWAEWIRNHESDPGFQAYRPVSGGPTGHNLSDTMWPWNGGTIPFGVPPYVNSPENVRPSDLIDHLALGYRYDTIDICPSIIIPPPKGIFPKEFLPKEFKELKEGAPKEFLPKELKERTPKEFIPKELKERSPKEFIPKEFKESGPKEFSPKEFVEGGRKRLNEGQLFIDPSLRPDLVGAELSFEPDIDDDHIQKLRSDLVARRANLLRR